MKITTKLFGLTATGIALATVHTSALAQVRYTIAYAPYAPVPTVSEWGMLALSVLVAAGALLALRKKVSNRTAASIALACALALAAVTGHKVVSDAYAVIGQCLMDNPAGGSTGCGPGYIAQNTSGVTQQIVNMSAVAAPIGSAPTPSVPILPPACAVGMVLSNLDSCSLPGAV